MWRIPSLAVTRNRVCKVRAKSGPVREVHGARFVKDVTVPVWVVQEVDESGILESNFVVLFRSMGRSLLMVLNLSARPWATTYIAFFEQFRDIMTYQMVLSLFSTLN